MGTLCLIGKILHRAGCTESLGNGYHCSTIGAQEGEFATAGAGTAGAMSMISSRPHYVLLSEAPSPPEESGPSFGHWRFVLESTDGSERMEVEDCEPTMDEERLELLTVIRGLEALDQPSLVTLVTPSHYVSRGLRYGLDQWRRNGWCWEYDGRMIPVTNYDLWQRLDRALRYHGVRCRSPQVAPWVASRGTWGVNDFGSYRPNPMRRWFWKAWSNQIRQRVGLIFWSLSARVRLRPAA